MRRRLIVFASAFLLSAVVGLAYTFVRPAIYVASAKLLVTPASKLPRADAPAAPAADAGGAGAVLVELQILNSRSLLENAVARLRQQGLFGGVDGDPVLAAQAMLEVTRIEGTGLIQVDAKGGDRALLPRLINELIAVYREQHAASGESSNASELQAASEEATVIDARFAERKQTLDAFRMRADIVSAERDENQTLSRLKGLGISLSQATDREAVAEGKLLALEQTDREGKRAASAKDNPTVAVVEQRLSQSREDWRALERQFTPQYLELDPNARALKSRIANLEQQLESERQKSQQGSLASAKEELVGAQAATRRLRQQLAEDKASVQSFSRRFAEFQAMQAELQGLEKMRLEARQRLLALQASTPARKPSTEIIEAAVTPESPWRPLYWRDAGISVAAALVLGFLAVWFVEFFNRQAPAPAGHATLVVAQPWPAMPGGVSTVITAGAGPVPLPGAATRPLLAAPPMRELDHHETRQLLANAAAENLAILVCLLSGVTTEELAALRVAHLSTQDASLTIPGEVNRQLALEGPMHELTARCTGLPGETVLFPGPTGGPLTDEAVEAIVTFSAHDAAVPDAEEISPQTLRHTYIAYLVRQGLRFSELGKVVGRVSPDQLKALSPLAPQASRVGLDSVDRVLPAVRALA
ncbi:MAG: hypothetical protein ABIR94_03610 [Rubrivivax sp.]